MASDKDDDDGGGGGWLISYADLMTLLFAAFVVLYGITPQGKGEVVRLVGAVSSIREAFVEVPDDIPLEQRAGPILLGKTVFKQFKGDTPVIPVIKKFKRSTEALNIINADVDRLKTLIKSLSENDNKKGRQAIEIKREATGIRLRLLSSHFYDQGSYRIKRHQLPKIKQIGELLQSINKKISIEGHTQKKPESNLFSNWELSALRASYIARFLINESNFPAKLITASGYADSQPIAQTSTARGEKMNRRVEIKVLYHEN